MSRSDILGIDPDIKKVFAGLYEDDVKKVTLHVDYSNDQDLEFAKNIIRMYVGYYLSVLDFNAEYFKKEFEAESNPLYPNLKFMADIHTEHVQ